MGKLINKLICLGLYLAAFTTAFWFFGWRFGLVPGPGPELAAGNALVANATAMYLLAEHWKK